MPGAFPPHETDLRLALRSRGKPERKGPHIVFLPKVEAQARLCVGTPCRLRDQKGRCPWRPVHGRGKPGAQLSLFMRTAM